MLDTVVITLNYEDFLIQYPERFTPSAINLCSMTAQEMGARKNMRWIQNPLKNDLKQGKYKPRLTLSNRIQRGGYIIQLKIEFSAPKLLFGNNFDELETQDFEKVIDTLHERLMEMGVLIRREVLRIASVSAIHYSKNIVLDDYTTSSMVINELRKGDMNKRLDLNKTDYRNGGHAIRYHANSYEIIFYDKIKDMEQAKVSEKRSIEKENEMQFDLFQSLKPKAPEVVRMEVRLGSRAKLKSILEDIGMPVERTFETLFQSTISQKLLLYYWEKISKSFSWFSTPGKKPEDIFQAIYRKGRTKPLKALQMVGGILLVESVGIRGLRSLIDKSSNRTWQRLKKEMETGLESDGQNGKVMNEIRHSLVEFSPIKLDVCKTLKSHQTRPFGVSYGVELE